MSELTKIQLKRSTKKSSDTDISDVTLDYGEPLFLNPISYTNEDGESGTKNSVLAIGNSNDAISSDTDFEKATYFNGFTSTDYLGKSVYYNTDNTIVNDDGDLLQSGKLTLNNVNVTAGDNTKYYVITSNNNDNKVDYFGHLYISGDGVLHGGVWNDYAETRICINANEPGQVVCEVGDGTLELSHEKLQAVPYVLTDTYGFAIGNDEEQFKPVAVAGRVLVKINCDVKIGDVLCADINGYATAMTREEIINYPDRILGIVCEIPTYDNWYGIPVNNRVWITIK